MTVDTLPISKLSSTSIMKRYDITRRQILDAIIALKIVPESRKVVVNDEEVYCNYFTRADLFVLISHIEREMSQKSA